jgi:hypothetical protein
VEIWISDPALTFWAYSVWFFNELEKSPFGYEVGSVAMRVPAQVGGATLLAVLLSVAGTLLLLIDLIRWIKNKRTDAARLSG